MTHGNSIPIIFARLTRAKYLKIIFLQGILFKRGKS